MTDEQKKQLEILPDAVRDQAFQKHLDALSGKESATTEEPKSAVKTEVRESKPTPRKKPRRFGPRRR